MRILQVSNRVPWPLNEGGTIGIYNYTRAFHTLGHDVTLYCLDGLKHNTPIKEAQTELSKYAKTYIHPIDTDVKPLEAIQHLIQDKSYNVSRFYNATFEQELISLLKTNTFDIVQLEGTFVGPYIETIRKYHEGVLSLRMHNVEYEIWERLAKNEKSKVKSWYLNKLAKQLKTYEAEIIKQVDIVVPVTDDDGAKFSKLYPAIDTFTIPAGIDLSTWNYSPTESIHSWYHIGSMEWHANAEAIEWYLQDIHPALCANQDYHLHLAGKGIANSNFNQPEISVHTDVPDAFDFVKTKDVCIVPLKSGSGIRLKILEAMAAGKLVISTTIGAQGIDYVNNENILIADTPAQFAALCTQLNSGAIDHLSIRKNARTLIEENYSTEALATKQLERYSSLT